MNVNDLIKQLPSALNAASASTMQSTIQYTISNPMYIVIENGKCTVHEGIAPSSDVNLKMADDDLAALLKGELNGVSAFMNGKLKLEGDMMLAQRLPSLFDGSKLG